MMSIDILGGLAVALGIGLLVEIERERRKGEGDARGAAGVRTFALIALAIRREFHDQAGDGLRHRRTCLWAAPAAGIAAMVAAFVATAWLY